MFRVHAVHTKLKFPKKVLNTTIRCGAVRGTFIWAVSCKACPRNMAAPTNIFGGASIVNAISWTVETGRLPPWDQRHGLVRFQQQRGNRACASDPQTPSRSITIEMVVKGRGSIGPSHVPVCNSSMTTINLLLFSDVLFVFNIYQTCLPSTCSVDSPVLPTSST